MLNFSAVPAGTFIGKVVRYPLRLIPRNLVVRILQGPLAGARWIAGSGNHGCWLGSFELAKQRQIAMELKPDAVFYDLGAHVGFYSLLAARSAPGVKVLAFEPLPRNVACLRAHVRLNGLENVQVFELAVSDTDGAANFEQAPDSSMGFLASQGKLSVRTARLDSLLEHDKLPPPTLIKMDIEGEEERALQGAAATIARFNPVIFLATHGSDLHHRCSALLRSWGYELHDAGSDPAAGRGELIARPGH